VNPGGAIRSSRRPASESRLLTAQGARAAVFELQGDLRFTTLQPVLRAVVGAGNSLEFAVRHFKRISHVDAGASRAPPGRRRLGR